jgi:hypothetical protein
MTPVYQTRPGTDGNCLQAAIASLLDMPLDAVPDFGNAPDAARTWPLEFDKWISANGFEVEAVLFRGDLPGVLGFMSSRSEYYILGCQDGRPARPGQEMHGHAVIGRGGEILHDPAGQSRDGLSLLRPLPGLDAYLVVMIRPVGPQALGSIWQCRRWGRAGKRLSRASRSAPSGRPARSKQPANNAVHLPRWRSRG